MNNKKTELSSEHKEKNLLEHFFFFRRECGIEDMGCNIRRRKRERTMLIVLRA